jgi:hypothetical protein
VEFRELGEGGLIPDQPIKELADLVSRPLRKASCRGLLFERRQLFAQALIVTSERIEMFWRERVHLCPEAPPRVTLVAGRLDQLQQVPIRQLSSE